MYLHNPVSVRTADMDAEILREVTWLIIYT